MAGNIFGHLFTLTTFGESHGPALGGIIDGCPAGVTIDEDVIQADLDRRKPGQSKIVTQRKEPDRVEIYSGVFEGMTTGTPIGFLIHNSNQKSKDYDHIKNSYRPSHADYVYDKKYGFRDYRGGGRSSARETVARVVAGSIAKQFMSGVQFHAFVSAVGGLKLENPHLIDDFSSIESNPVRCPDPTMAGKMEDYIKKIRKDGDTVGGVMFRLDWGNQCSTNFMQNLAKPCFRSMLLKDLNMEVVLLVLLGVEANTMTCLTSMAQQKQTILGVFKGGLAMGWISTSTLLLSLLQPSCKIKTQLTSLEMKL